MKVSDEMVERAARALWMRATSDPWDGASEKFREHYLKDARAALETALEGCKIVKAQKYQFRGYNGLRKSARIRAALNASMVGKRVALVPLDE